MEYSLIERENNVISCVFDDNIEIAPELYSAINHNTIFMLPCMRDLSTPTIINYDTLGSVPMVEEIQSNAFDKDSLYSLIHNLLDALENVSKLGIASSQIVLNINYIYFSLFDKSVRFVCLPLDAATLESADTFSTLFKSIALNINSNGAYELIGFLIEKASLSSFDISEFKRDFESIFGETDHKPATPVQSVSAPTPVPESTPLHAPASDTFSPSHDDAFVGREYIPAGVPLEYNGNISSGSDTIEPDSTQLLFPGTTDIGNVPFLSPVDNNSDEAKLYIVGTKFGIGRSSDNDLQIPVSTVSGKHAEIVRVGNKCTITDLNSTNKTYVNGTPITPNSPVELKHNDLISFNKIRYRFFEY